MLHSAASGFGRCSAVVVAARRAAARAGAPMVVPMRWRTDWGSAIPVKMPALSPTMTSGTVSAWLAQEGQEVQPGDSIATIDTDKASVDYEVQDNGILAKILVPAGTEDVSVGRVLALMVDNESDLPDVQGRDWEALLGSAGGAQDASGHAHAEPEVQEQHGDANFGDKRVSPAAAHIVRSHGLDISGVSGTGRHGMVTKGDVLVLMGKAPPSSLPQPESHASKAPSAASSDGSNPSAPAVATSAPAPAAAAPALALGDVLDLGGNLPAVSFGDGTRPASAASPGSFTDEKPSMVRKVIAARLTESKAQVPHSYSVMDCRIDALLTLRKQLKAAGVAVSVNDLVIKAVARALQEVPEANCRFDEQQGRIVANESVDISVAVATDGGLITPIVTHADTRGLAGINEAVRDLASRARSGKLAPEEYQGGSFTVSNLGMFGIDEFSAVINPPQACILAVGRGATRPVFPGETAVDVASLSGEEPQEEPEAATMMSVMMSADRRVVDDVTAAQFLAAFRQNCETPALLMA